MEDPNIDSQPQPPQPSQPPYLKFLEEKKKPIIFVIFVVIILLLVIFTTREPEATIKDIEVKDYSIPATWILFEITLDVENGNIIGGTLNYLEVDIYYNGDYIGHARTTEKYEIKALGVSTLKVDLRIDNLPSFIFPPLKIRAKGTANISIFFLTFDKEIDDTVYG